MVPQPAPIGGALGAKVAQDMEAGAPPIVRTGYPYVTPLKELCIEVVAANFAERPEFGKGAGGRGGELQRGVVGGRTPRRSSGVKKVR